MFFNTGNKIKIASKMVSVMGIILSIVGGIKLIKNFSFACGLLTLIGGIALTWLIALLMYGFGELIESTRIISLTCKLIEYRMQKEEKESGNEIRLEKDN